MFGMMPNPLGSNLLYSVALPAIAADIATPLVEWNVEMLVSIPDSGSNSLIHLATVHNFTGL